MKKLDALHTCINLQGKLSGAEFFSKREKLMKQLDSSLGPLVRKGVSIPNHPKLKNALGISSRSLVHHWSKAGTAGGIAGYATHIEWVSKASKVIKAGGWIGVGLGAGASGLKVKETCRVGTDEACRKVKFTEFGKLGVGVVGGALGGLVGVGVCLGLGVVTADVGGVACSLILVGAGTIVGTSLGEGAGEIFGEIVHDRLSDER
ncbi:hypothetical protein [Pseudomonas sp. NFX15]|uniref:hypothetical protein n=1 Tax=Pseudomonas sp. NFX15 TaxID=2816958 RepID=UPI003B8BEF21